MNHPTTQTFVPQLKALDQFSKLLDTRFRIPGTQIRFGVDFLIGLIPFAGDLLSFLFSGGLIITMARHGASGQLIARMILNVIVDTVVGSIPIIGDLFDLYFKANRQNYKLLEKHYGEGEYKGNIWRVLVPVLIALLLTFILLIWLIVKVVSVTWGFIFS